jgi:hypothetical protein
VIDVPPPSVDAKLPSPDPSTTAVVGTDFDFDRISPAALWTWS